MRRGPARPAHRPVRRGPGGAGARDGRRAAGGRRDRRLALRGHARGRPGVAGHPRLPRQGRARPVRNRLRRRVAGRSRRTSSRPCRTATSGTGCPRRGCGACGPGTPAPPSTPIRTPGPRWASPARPTRAATRTPGVGKREPFEVADTRPAEDPVGGRRLMRLRVRDRNESAWLLPNDGTRTNHRLRRDMRRFADSDEIDMVIVGCGAGGSVLAQRLARAGWRVAALDAGPFWDPDADWVSDEAGSHHLYWTEPRVIDGSDPVPMGSNNSGPRRRRLDGPLRGLHAPVPPERLRHLHRRRGGRRLAARLRRPAALLRRHRAGTAGGRASTGRGATRTATRTGRIRSAGTARSSCAARASSGSPPRSARSPSPTAGSATGRTASTAGSACRAARSTPRRRR